MAKRYGNGILQLKGFTELLEKVKEAGGDIDKVTNATFQTAANNMTLELESKAAAAGLSQELIWEIEENWYDSGEKNVWRAEVGWKKQRPTKGNPIPNTYKVLFFNYGTPRRTTKKGYNRGEEPPHPKGSHGFIKKAKLAVARKNKKLYDEALNKILKELQ